MYDVMVSVTLYQYLVSVTADPRMYNHLSVSHFFFFTSFYILWIFTAHENSFGLVPFSNFSLSLLLRNGIYPVHSKEVLLFPRPVCSETTFSKDPPP